MELKVKCTWHDDEKLWLGTLVFIAGLAAMLIRMYFIQKKYNGVIFS